MARAVLPLRAVRSVMRSSSQRLTSPKKPCGALRQSGPRRRRGSVPPAHRASPSPPAASPRGWRIYRRPPNPAENRRTLRSARVPPAIEQRLVPFDGVDDRQKTDLIRRARQPVAAAHPFAGDDDPRLFQLGENLGQKAGEMPCSSASSRLLSARWLSPTSHSRQWMPYSTLVVMYAICPFSTVNEPSITQTI